MAVIVNTEVNAEKALTERQAVEAAAAMVVSLVREHRRDIAGQRRLVDVLKAQLQAAIGQRELLEELIVEETAVICFRLRNRSSCSRLIVSGIGQERANWAPNDALCRDRISDFGERILTRLIEDLQRKLANERYGSA